MRILIVGAGGHAQVAADVIVSRQRNGDDTRLAGFLDDNAQLTGAMVLGERVWGKLDRLDEVPHDAIVIGIGDNATRAQVFLRVQQHRESLATLVHPRAIVAEDVVIGEGTVVFAGAIINTGAIIGPNVIINTGATVDHHAQIGAHVHLAPGVHLGGTVTVGEGAFLGVGVNVIPNRTSGAWTTVGAGATVIEDLPDRVVAVGTPARIVKTLSIMDQAAT